MFFKRVRAVKNRIVDWYFHSPVFISLLRVFSCNGFLASFWYLLTGEFSREHRAVLFGRYKHLKGLQHRTDSGAVYTLRRNTHRLEKGIIMRPRRDVFAGGYIEETVSVYQGVAALNQKDGIYRELVQWSHDVLSEYFSLVGSSRPIDRARSAFTKIPTPQLLDDSQKSPYCRPLQRPINITIDDLENLAIRRRSCRWFLQKPVPRELIDSALRVAAYSPSACNRQPFEFRFFDDPAVTPAIGDIPMGTKGFSENFPCVAVIVGKLDAFPYDRDRHVSYIDASLASMAFQFGLEVQGVSSCCINWPDIKDREKAIRVALNLQADERVIMMMAIGYPDQTGMVPYSQKKNLDELRSYNKHAH